MQFLQMIMQNMISKTKDVMPFYRYDLAPGTTRLLDGDVGIHHIIDDRLCFKGHLRNDSTIHVMDIETGGTMVLSGDGLHRRDKGLPRLTCRNSIFIGDAMHHTKRTLAGGYDHALVGLSRYGDNESTLTDGCTDGGTYRIGGYPLFGYEGRLCYVVREDGERRLVQYDPGDGVLTVLATYEGFYSDGRIAGGCPYYLGPNRGVHRVGLGIGSVRR